MDSYTIIVIIIIVIIIITIITIIIIIVIITIMDDDGDEVHPNSTQLASKNGYAPAVQETLSAPPSLSAEEVLETGAPASMEHLEALGSKKTAREMGDLSHDFTRFKPQFLWGFLIWSNTI